MAPNLVGARNQQSSRQETTTARLSFGLDPRTIRNRSRALSLTTPPTDLHLTRAVASPALYTDLRNWTPTLSSPPGANALFWILRAARRSPRPFAYTGRPTGPVERKRIVAQYGCCESDQRCQTGRAQHAWAEGEDGKSIFRRGQGWPVSWSRAICALGEQKNVTDIGIVKQVLC